MSSHLFQNLFILSETEENLSNVGRVEMGSAWFCGFIQEKVTF